MRIAINGAGIAGPALAWWLQKYSHEPIIFEKAQERRRGGYIIDFWGKGYDIAQRMGIIPELKKRGYIVNHLKIINHRGRELAALDLSNLSNLLQDQYLSISRDDFSEVLIELCDKIDIRYGISIEEVVDNGTFAQVKLSDGSVEKFDLVIGADGLHSNIRNLVFGNDQNFERYLGIYVAAYTIDDFTLPENLTYFLYSKNNKQVGSFALRGGKSLFYFIFRPNSAQKDFLEANLTNQDILKQFLVDEFHDMGWQVPKITAQIQKAPDFYFDRVSQIEIPHWSHGRIGLIGDAAACISLLGGEGIGLALIEAYVLAGEIHTSENDISHALEHYEEKLYNFLKQKQKNARQSLSFFAPKNFLQKFMQIFGVKLAALPLFSNLLLKNMIGDEIELKEYEK